MKKVLAIITSFILALSCVMPAFAAAGATLSVSSGSGLPGETVTLTFSISDNPGMCSAGFAIDYDGDVLTLNSVDASHGSPIASAATGKVGYMGYENDYFNGTLFTATFGIKSGAAAGQTTVSLDVDDFSDENGDPLGYTVSSGKITVQGVTPTAVTGVTLNKTTASVNIGSTVTLTPTVAPSNATNKSVTWSSDDTSVATVSGGVVTGVAEGSAVITATTVDGGHTAACTVTVNADTPTAVSGVELNHSSLSLLPGERAQLSATVLPEDAANKAVTWDSSNKSAATVDAQGTVTAVAAGSTTITVTTVDGSKKATCTVTVKTPAFTVSVGSASGRVGSTVSIPVNVTANTGFSYLSMQLTYNQSALRLNGISAGSLISAADIHNGTVVYMGTGNITGTGTLCTAEFEILEGASGSVNVTARVDELSYTAGGADKNITPASNGGTVTVQATPVTSVSLNKTSTSMLVGGSETLTATVLPTDATNKNVTWSSSDTNVAIVTNGRVTGMNAGTATITVTTADGSKTASCTVTVTTSSVAVTGVTLNKSTTELTVGGSETLTAAIAPANATNQNVTWSSSDTKVATVSGGKITAKAAGTATITVTTADGSKTASCTVTVKTIAVTGVKLDRDTLKIDVGSTSALSATVTPSDATNKKVSWTSSDTKVATVSSEGKVTGVAAGTATITVKTSDGEKTASCKVTVSAVPVQKVSIEPQSASLIVGKSLSLKAVFTPSNATNKNVTWSIDNPTVATITSGGTVTAAAAGTAQVKVTSADGGKTAVCTVTVENPSTGVYDITNTLPIEWKKGNTDGLTITSSADTAKFSGVYVDDEKLSPLSYTVAAPQTTVTLTAEYLEGLTEGSHKIEIASIDGQAAAQFTILSKCTHAATKVENERAATCIQDGYSGDIYCAECGEKIEDGKVTPKVEHNFADGVCTVCGVKDPNAAGSSSVWDTVATIAGWVAVGAGATTLIVVIGMVISKIRNKKKSIDD